MPPKASRAPGVAPGGATSTRQQRDWGHPEGIPLWQVEVDTVYDGIVTNTRPFGVFVDFGAVKDGLLRVPQGLARSFRKGMELKNLVVLSVDAEGGRVELEMNFDELPELPPRQPAGVRAKSAGAASAAGAPRQSNRPRRKWDHSEATPLEELHDGDVYEGVVTNVGRYGVFVDIGAVRDARLNVSAQIGRRFRRGDVVEDCTLEIIDLEKQLLAASLPDPEEAVRDLPPKERRSRSASRAGRPKAKAQPQQPQEPRQEPRQTQRQTQRLEQRQEQQPEQDSSNLLRIEDLEVGNLCDGVVSNVNQYGVFVSIGCAKDAKLLVPGRFKKSFLRGDEIYGMKIESIDLESNKIAVSLDDPELSMDETDEVAPAPAPAARQTKAPPAAKRTAAAATAKATPKPKAKAVAAKAKPKAAPVDHASGQPITRFRKGSTANGTVTKINAQGVYVDVGAVTDGLLKLPRAVAKQFQVDDEVHGMTIEEVDTEAHRLILSLDDPELEEAEYVPAPAPRTALPRQEPSSGSRQNAKATVNGRASEEKPKGKVVEEQPKTAARAKGKAKEQAAPVRDGGTLPFEELEPGTQVSGIVTSVSQWGVMVDLGAEREGKLDLSYRDWRSFRKGEELTGLLVEHVDFETESIWLQLANEDEAPLPPGPSSRSTTAKPTGPKRAAAESAASAARPTSKRTAAIK